MGPPLYFIGMVGSLDALPAEAMVDRKDHPSGHKHSDELDIPNNLEVLRCELWSDTSNLSINHPGI